MLLQCVLKPTEHGCGNCLDLLTCLIADWLTHSSLFSSLSLCSSLLWKLYFALTIANKTLNCFTRFNCELFRAENRTRKRKKSLGNKDGRSSTDDDHVTDVVDQSPDVVSTSSNSAPGGSSCNYAELEDINSTTLPGDTYNNLDADRRQNPTTGFYWSLTTENGSKEVSESLDYCNVTFATLLPTSTATTTSIWSTRRSRSRGNSNDSNHMTTFHI